MTRRRRLQRIGSTRHGINGGDGDHQAGVEAGELATAEGYGGREIFFHFFALHHGLAMLRLTRMWALPEEVFGPIGVAVRDYVRSLTSGDQKERS